MIGYDEEFLIATFPTTPKGVAKVIPGRGVKVNQIHYWSDRFRNPAVEGTLVAVRYDPFDAGAAYAFVERQSDAPGKSVVSPVLRIRGDTRSGSL
jgi:putative transposase